MNKKFAAALAAMMLLPILAACSDKTDSTAPAAEATAAPTAEISTEPVTAFEEITLIDNEHCTFRITAIEDSSIWGYTLKAYLENKTDMDLMFSLDSVSVNGFMCDPFWASTVSPGMKANKDISFSAGDFERSGITDVTSIEFTLNVYDANNWASDHLVTEAFTIYPMGEAAAQDFVRTPVDGETVLFENENCAMVITGFDPDNALGYTVNVYLENKTDKNLMFSIGNAAVNGFMCDPFWAETVAAGKRSNTEISWSDSAFAENGITDVESLTLPISVYDADNWMDDYLIDETFTINP